MAKLVVVISLLTFSFNANAEWGQSWGSMVWGQSSTNIPMMGSTAQIMFFALLLCIGLIASRHWGAIRSLPANEATTKKFSRLLFILKHVKIVPNGRSLLLSSACSSKKTREEQKKMKRRSSKE